MFNVGDAAWLKQDSDVCMTVTKVKDEEVTCVWFNSEKDLNEGIFPAAALEIAAEDDTDNTGEMGAIPPTKSKFT